MNWRIVGALIAKDFTLFFRNKFIAVITVLSISIFVVIYLVMPSTTTAYEFGLYAPVVPPVFVEEDDANYDFAIFNSEEALRAAVTENDYIAGIALTADIMEKFERGEKPDVKLYFSAEANEVIRNLVRVLVEGLSYQQTGQFTEMNTTEIVLGPDLLGRDIPLRDRMRPLFAVVLLMMEMFALADLIIVEVERRTVQGLLVTPVRVRELFTAKCITGVLLAFVQAALFMVIAGGMASQPLIVITALLLGALLVTGISFLTASLSKDFMSSIGWILIAFIVLIIPAIGIMMPGTITSWAKIIPSYYIVLPIHQAVHYGSGWGDVWPYLLALGGFDIIFVWIGIAALRSKFQ
ncbi:MAG: ABC transporter permease [Dehalococcoidia bacterium]|nr:ABC transporter permease [Dehalococcoidia bacterium]